MKSYGRPQHHSAYPAPDDRRYFPAGHRSLLDRLGKQEPHRLKQFKPLGLGIQAFQDGMLGHMAPSHRALGRRLVLSGSLALEGNRADRRVVTHASTLPPARGGQVHCSRRLSRSRDVETSRVNALMFTQAPRNRSMTLEKR